MCGGRAVAIFNFIDIKSPLEDGESRRESIEELDERVDGEACVPSRFSAWASRLVGVALTSSLSQ